MAVLGQVVNQVLARAPNSTQFLPASVGVGLSAGSRLRTTAGSLARLDFPDASFLRLAPGSDLALDSGPTETGLPILRARLFAGKVWAIMSDGTLQLYSPAGVATLRGKRASVEFVPGDASQVSRITLIVDCVEAECSVQTEAARQELHSGEQLRVSANGSQDARSQLPDNALHDFLVQNPESVEPAATTAPLVEATPTTAVISASPSPIAVSATQAAPSETVQPPSPSLAPTTPAAVRATPTTGTPLPPGIIGQHIVRGGETLYCIARVYRVLPQAIVTTNGLADASALAVDQSLDIPSVPWPNPSPGPECQPQFVSPYVAAGASPASATPPAAGATPAGPGTTAEPVVVDVWATPVNLSRSGSASQPALTVDVRGNYYAAWWDRFDGARYMVYQPGQGWSARMTVPVLFGATPAPNDKTLTPPTSWRLLADDNGALHALWVDTTGHLMHASNASPASGGPWSAPVRLASQVLVWTAKLEGNTVHVAFVQSDQDGGLPPGIYYRRLADGSRWDTAQSLAASPYFRSLPANAAHLDLAVSDAGEVDVAWDDPQSLSSQYNRSRDDGQSFSGPVALSAADPRVDVQARHLRLLPVRGGFLRQWEFGGDCNLYQQQLSGPDGSWSAPVRVLEQLPGCLTDSQIYPLPDGRLVLWASVNNRNSSENIVSWNGNRWSQSLRADFSFVNRASNRPAALSCLQTALSGEQIVVLGCDARGDVWVTASQLSLNDLLPALANEWRPLVSLSDPSTNAGLPSAALDGGVIHALWPQDLPGNLDQQRLYYSRGSGQDWTPSAQVLQLQHDGPVNMPIIVSDPAGWLHAVWSGGPNGQVYYSRSYIRDAGTAQGWSPPKALPARQASGGWPAMIMEPNGRLVVIYTLPFNEDRGVYQIESSDEGQTWSDSSLVFDAAAAGWSTVQGTQLTVDTAGRLHLLVVRGSLPPAGTPLGVYYLRSDDGGRTWSKPGGFGGSGAGYPRLVATARGELFRFWVQPSSSQQPVWQQWSQDGGQSWSAASLVPGLQGSAPNLGLASDGQGAIFLVAVMARPDQSAAMVYVRWDGQQWVDQQYLPLGYTADSASGATAILLPSHRLGVFYRVTTSANPGIGPYIVGYTERAVPGTDLAALPTLTPALPPAATGTPGPPPTLTAIPTLDIVNRQLTTPLPGTTWKPIAGILAVMLLILAVAVRQLTARRH